MRRLFKEAQKYKKKDELFYLFKINIISNRFFFLFSAGRSSCIRGVSLLLVHIVAGLLLHITKTSFYFLGSFKNGYQKFKYKFV
jgi:maltodextrin utilization protein YvdJ